MDLSSVPPWAWAGILTVALGFLSLVLALGKWMGSINEHKKQVTAFMDEVRDDIKKILGRLPPTTTTGSSPLALTDFGDEISKDLGAKGWAQRTADRLRDQITGKQDYEVQEFCFDYVTGDETKLEMGDLIRSCAYEHGIDQQGVLDVLAIELRDVLLAQKGSDRDKHKGSEATDLPSRLSP